jgi:hypothetical protein
MSGSGHEEILATLRAYQSAIEQGGREEAQSYCTTPVGYIDDRGTQLCNRYPYDPEKLRENTGFHHANLQYNIIHADKAKAHVLLEGTRHRADKSVIERIDAVYIVNKIEGAWKISAFSGIRSPATQVD